MLANDFYSIHDICLTPDGFEAQVLFNETHRIFQSHFPGNPITPGVCLLQIAKELLADHLQTPLTMVSAKNIKFLNILEPVPGQLFCFAITTATDSTKGVKAAVVVKNESTVFAKINATYQQA